MSIVVFSNWFFCFFSTRLKFGSSIDPSSKDLPSKAKIVIVGGGAQGSAIAYKLAQQGLGPDTVILDQVSTLIHYLNMNQGLAFTFLP